MSNSSQVPILMLEDDELHSTMVVDYLRSKNFAVTPFTMITNDSVTLLEFIAKNPDTQIVIVDLLLGSSVHGDKTEGLRTIKETFWRVNKTAFFIVFSQNMDKPIIPRFCEVEPHLIFVQKEVVDGKITEDSLANLSAMVEQCYSCCAPVLVLPQHHSLQYLDHIAQFLKDKNRDFQTVREAILQSTALLNELSQAVASFAKAGEAANHLSMGVYGSCGRLEKRSESDVEISVFVSDNRDRQLAVDFWNRAKTYCEHKGWEYEGKSRVFANNPPLLLIHDAETDLNEHGFRPIISKESLLPDDINRQSKVRNRHWQILTEWREVFNTDLALALKKEIIVKYLGSSGSSPLVIAQAKYFSDMCDQFFMDAQPKGLKGKELKKFCYRILNLLAFRFPLISEAIWGKKLDTRDDWLRYTELLSEPGTIKVLRFTNEAEGRGFGGRVKNQLHSLVEAYFAVMELFLQFGNDENANIVAQARNASEAFVNTFKVMKKEDAFRKLASTDWLFSTEKVEMLMNSLG